MVPVFNRADLLGPCLDSALAQTMTDFEIIVVDGASTDGTWEVCQRYAAADPRVRVFRDPVNTGPPRGWWRCAEEAAGAYATFLWSDDVLQPTFLERTVPVLGDRDVAFVFTAAEIGAQPGGGEVHYAHPSGLMRSREFIDGSLRASELFPVSPACALFRLADIRSDFILELPTEPPVDLTLTGAGIDQLLFLRAALRYPYVACISEPLAFFRAHAGSLTIDGRGGQVALGYALASNWFAQSIGDRDLSRTILARHWLREMRRSRRWFNPATAVARYGHPMTAAGLVVTAGRYLAGRSARAVAARFSQRPGPSAAAD